MPSVSPEVIFEESKAQVSLLAFYQTLQTKLQVLDTVLTAIEATSNRLAYVAVESSIEARPEMLDFLVSFATAQGFRVTVDYKKLPRHFIVKSEAMQLSLRKLHEYISSWSQGERHAIMLAAPVAPEAETDQEVTLTEALQIFSEDIQEFILSSKEHGDTTLYVRSTTRLGRLIDRFMESETEQMVRHESWYITRPSSHDGIYSIMYKRVGHAVIPDSAYLEIAWLFSIIEEENTIESLV